MRVKNKSIIVMGAGGRYGEGIALRLAAEGGLLVVNDINQKACDRVVAEIQEGGGTAIGFCADMSQSENVMALLDAAVMHYGKLDAIVNNVGWRPNPSPVHQFPSEDYLKSLNTNLTTFYWTVTHGVPVFEMFGKGCIVSIGSSYGVRPKQGLGWYSVTKSALIAATQAVASEVKEKNIRVNCVNPAYPVESDLEDHADAWDMPRGKFASTLDVANAVLFLTSDEAKHINGVSLNVDGAGTV